MIYIIFIILATDFILLFLTGCSRFKHENSDIITSTEARVEALRQTIEIIHYRY